jgi:hypothetical protein
LVAASSATTAQATIDRLIASNAKANHRILLLLRIKAPNAADQRLATLDYPHRRILSRVRCIGLLGQRQASSMPVVMIVARGTAPRISSSKQTT